MNFTKGNGLWSLPLFRYEQKIKVDYHNNKKRNKKIDTAESQKGL
jgi:hypothetical protein